MRKLGTLLHFTSRCHKECDNRSVDLLQATEPELLETLLEIDRAERLYGDTLNYNLLHVIPGSSGSVKSLLDSRGCTSTVYSCWKLPIPQRTSSDLATHTVNPWELPRLQCQNSQATRTLACTCLRVLSLCLCVCFVLHLVDMLNCGEFPNPIDSCSSSG